MHYIDQHWIEVLLLSCSDVCTEMNSLVILKWPKQQQMIGIAVRAIHCILGSDYEETQKRETRRRETLNRIPARHLALHSGSDVQIGGAAAEIGAPPRRGEIWRDQIVIFMFSARAGNISLAPIHFPPYLSALIPETPGRFPEIRSPSPDIC